MPDVTDYQLLRQHAGEASEEAFKVLVDRYLNLVYSVAMSRLGNEASAKDITQVVFAALARKGSGLSEKVVLSGWLFQLTTHACQDHQRSEARRKKWENEAVQEQLTQSNDDRSYTTGIPPMVGRALSSLSAAERDAILLRYIENREFRQVGVQLGISEAAAKMRVARGLERLRALLQRRGVTVSEAALCGAFPSLVQHAPDGLAAAVKASAVLHASLSQSNTLLLKGVLHTMAWSNAKAALVVGGSLLLAAGGATTLYFHTHHSLASPESSGSDVVLASGGGQGVAMAFPRSSWDAAGNDSPPSALAHILSIASKGDGEHLLSSMSPRLQDRMQKEFAQQIQAQGASLAQILAQMGQMWVRGVDGFDVTGQDTSDDGISLHVQFKGRHGDGTFRLKKIEGEWKLDNFS